jgi:uncharacterized protein (TIGR02594 family)
MRTAAIAACLALGACSTTGTGGKDMATLAGKYDGLHERKDRAVLTRLGGVDPYSTPWCGAFAAHVVTEAGHEPPAGHLKASQWATFGRAARTPSRGDVVVMRNHVTFYTRTVGGRVCGIGGNQGNAVREGCFSARSVIAVRRPAE